MTYTCPFLRRHRLARQADHPFDQVRNVLLLERGSLEYDDVAPADPVEVVAQLVDHDPVAHLESRLHGWRRNLERLDRIDPDEDHAHQDQDGTDHDRHPLDQTEMAMLYRSDIGRFLTILGPYARSDPGISTWLAGREGGRVKCHCAPPEARYP